MSVQQPGYSSRILFFLLTAATLLGTATAEAQPIRLTAELGDERSEIEVRDLRTDKGKAAIQAAFAEMTAMLELVEGPGPNQVILEAGAEPRTVDKRFGALALRAQQFCLWSNGAFGPLAGMLAVQRTALREQGEGADLAAFGQALTSAQCQNIRVTAAADGEPLLSIAEGSGLDLRGWLRGFVIDRAVEILREHGAGNAWVELGPIRRGIGAGPTGEGWPVILSFPGIETPVASVYLRDQAMAIITPLTPRGKREPELVDQRNGREPHGIVAVIAVTELGIDAETLAITVTIIGLNEGRMRLASLKPLPSALVLLGDGTGPPVRADYRWLELPQIPQPTGGR